MTDYMCPADPTVTHCYHAAKVNEIIRTHADEITALRAENERLRVALGRFVDEYERTHFIRTADLHEQDCRCLRCAYDNARAALEGK